MGSTTSALWRPQAAGGAGKAAPRYDTKEPPMRYSARSSSAARRQETTLSAAESAAAADRRRMTEDVR